MAQTLADAIAEAFADHGVKRMFGVPGGGSSLDLIDAAARRRIEFILCRTETAAALMAAVTGELTGVPGIALTGIGPGAASATNGIAYAALERAPVVHLADAHAEGATAPPHQIFDQRALFAPITKAQARLDPETGATRIRSLLDLASAAPAGPVHIDLSSRDAGENAAAPEYAPAMRKPALDADAVERTLSIIAGCRRAVLIVGLQARSCAAATGRLAEALGAPVMLTYKAKGVVADDHPLTAGLFTGARRDAEVLSEADLILFCGVDPVEMIPGEWIYGAPAVVVSTSAGLAWPFTPETEIAGPLGRSLEALADSVNGTAWTAAEIAVLRRALRNPLTGDGHTAESVIETLAAAAPERPRLAVDAGAHMFSVMARWPARRPHDVLKSNGLSTMGFAVPAALAGWLEEPERRALAVTGDGGMAMCLGELSTAARLGAKLTVIVLNDAALSLIDIKQQRRQHPPLGVRYPSVDFAAAARGMGCAAWTVGRREPLESAVAEALAHDGPGLIDIDVDPAGYRDQLAALRG